MTSHSATEPESAASISLILPAWNESQLITRAIQEADQALGKLTGAYEIIVVDDGSSDDTAALVDLACQSNPAVRLIRHDNNRGYGAAIKTGFTAAGKQLIVFTDSDCQFDLNELDRFILLAGKYDIVCGYRIDRKDSPLRCFYSKVYNQLVRILLGTRVRDIDCALKMFRRDVAQDLTISTDGFLVNSELLTSASQKDYSVVEVGVTHRPRTAGSSTVSMKHIPLVLASLFRYWWNAVQFPAEDPPTAVTEAALKKGVTPLFGWTQAVLVLCAALFLLTNLGFPLIDRDETRYAEIPREMLATGNWVLPQLNFQPYYDKPPLLYWLCAASYRMYGVSEWSARLVPGLAGLCLFVSTLCFGTFTFGRRAGSLSAIVLLLSVGFVFVGRYLLIDGLFTALTTLSIICCYEAVRVKKIRLRWWIAGSLMCGLAFLAKGPISIVLLIPPIFAFSWIGTGTAKILLRHWSLMGATIAAVTLPWFIAVHLQDAQFTYEFFYNQNVKRFAGAFHQKPFWFFVPVLMIAGHPWTFLTIPMSRFLLSRKSEARSRRPPVLGFCVLWSAWCFTFFSLSSCKLPTYLLPAAPPLALLVGYYLDLVLFTAPHVSMFRFARVHAAWLSAVFSCVAAIGLLVYAAITQLESSGILVTAAILWCTVIVFVVFVVRTRRDSRLLWGVCTAAALLLVACATHWLIPRYASAQSVLGPGSPLVSQHESIRRLPVATFAHEWSGIPFYLNRDDVRNFSMNDVDQLSRFVTDNPQSILVIKDKQSLDQLQGWLPRGIQLQALGHRGRGALVLIDSMSAAWRISKHQDLHSVYTSH